jgi:hypothetical protein
MAWRPAIAADEGSQVRWRHNASCPWMSGILKGVEVLNGVTRLLVVAECNTYEVAFGDCEVEYDRNALP